MIDEAHQRGLKVIVGTPTYAVPPRGRHAGIRTGRCRTGPARTSARRSTAALVRWALAERGERPAAAVWPDRPPSV
ncbi:hypothetical protein ACFPOI_32065 [Nonomuraea angiospora]|uniref:Uncharacterized protein n=1 Tax=Nonomuraea angiospora TaxID=46172 RepID=A0ABR9LS25_9ACTN|nr:hypothetical protein [Nonomuraea angiospora]MBE1583462.1 hypothetical protein [Nonomuraea angiospora]